MQIEITKEQALHQRRETCIFECQYERDIASIDALQANLYTMINAK